MAVNQIEGWPYLRYLNGFIWDSAKWPLYEEFPYALYKKARLFALYWTLLLRMHVGERCTCF